MNPDYSKEKIRIGTLAQADRGAAYLRQIIPHGFESFQLTFWQQIGDSDIPKLAAEVNETIAESGAIISSIGIYGNPLESDADAAATMQGWEALIENAHLFGTDIVTGFTGRLRGKPIPDSLPRFKQIFGELAKRAADKGVRIAFENCDMGGTWDSGDWNIAHNPTAWEMMFDAVPAENLGLEWEPCHQMVSLIDPMPQLRKWVGKIFHIHGKDCTIHWDVVREYGIHGPKQFAFHRTPGFGDSNWTDIISELRWAGFEGSIDIEGWHDPVYRETLEMTGQVSSLHYLKRCRGGFFIENPE
jgi:sugar phosphate isomerase/epimerase